MSRRLEDLAPCTFEKANQFLEICSSNGFDILIYNTLRSLQQQARLFRRGRDFIAIQEKANELAVDYKRPDLAKILMGVGPQFEPRIVTHAGPGQSLHNYGYAFDFVPMRDGKPVWGNIEEDDYVLWEGIGSCVVEVGLEWGGDWEGFKDYPHAQEVGQDWKKLITECLHER